MIASTSWRRRACPGGAAARRLLRFCVLTCDTCSRRAYSHCRLHDIQDCTSALDAPTFWTPAARQPCAGAMMPHHVFSRENRQIKSESSGRQEDACHDARGAFEVHSRYFVGTLTRSFAALPPVHHSLLKAYRYVEGRHRSSSQALGVGWRRLEERGRRGRHNSRAHADGW